MSKHTPGPWEAFCISKYDEWHVSAPLSQSAMRLTLFDNGVQSENPESDAHLIAAAPDMLWCLEQIQAGETMTPEMILAIDAAIRKATGSAS